MLSKAISASTELSVTSESLHALYYVYWLHVTSLHHCNEIILIILGDLLNVLLHLTMNVYISVHQR